MIVGKHLFFSVIFLFPLGAFGENSGYPGKNFITKQLLRTTTQRMNRLHNHFLVHYYAPSLPLTRGSESPYLGNVALCTTQLLLQHHKAKLGITAKIREGEAFCWDRTTNRYGFNLWSAFFAIMPGKYVKQIVIGDFQIGYGQGLLLGSAQYRREMAIDPIIRSHNMGIAPCSVIRPIKLRGIAGSFLLGPIEVTGFYAKNHLDATLEVDEQHRDYVDHIVHTARYNNPDKLARKGTLQEQVVGCTLLVQRNKNKTAVGINLLYHHYNLPIWPAEDAFHLLHGQRALATSLFYRFLWHRLTFFGEGGISSPNTDRSQKNPEKAIITGLIIQPTFSLRLPIALYHYGKGFYNPYGKVFKYHSTDNINLQRSYRAVYSPYDNANEKGVYGGFQFTPSVRWKIALSGHFFATLSPKPRVPVTSKGYSWATYTKYAFKPETIGVIQHEFSKTVASAPYEEQDGLASDEPIAPTHKNNVRLLLDHKFTLYWQMHLEVLYIYHALLQQAKHGYALSSTQKWTKGVWQLACQVIYFHTQDDTTPLHLSEPNPLFNPTPSYPYDGHGIATIWLVGWKYRRMHLTCKYSFKYDFQKVVNKPEIAIYKNYIVNNQHKIAIQWVLNLY